MCGIVAVLRRPGAKIELEALAEAMVNLQNHRGPDNQSVLTNHQSDFAFGHSRLAILDLSTEANQPLASKDGVFTIVFNGEIYNWKELREQLIKEGYGPFSTNSDTEVLLEAYRHFGYELPLHLRGMFAFVIYDSRSDEFFCARDRIGKKPLVYAATKDGVAITSEIPAAKLMLPGAPELNHSAIASMLLHNMRHVPDPDTAFQGVQRLRPGHAMVLSGGLVKKIWRYWTPESNRKKATISELRAAIDRAVEIRMEADVPVGAMLSGGVDSTAVVALMSQKSSRPISTYALGFDANDEDLRRARDVAERLGCNHREFYFDPERHFEIYRNLLRTYGEPIALLPLIQGYELCEAIHQDGIKVVLAGHGADELFYGYEGHIQTAVASEFLRFLAPFRPLARMVPERKRRGALALVAEKPGERKAALYRSYEAGHWGKLLNKSAVGSLVNGAARECSYWGSILRNPYYIDESNFIALMMENAHSVTTAADLPAMMASVEMRAPFLDREVVDLALSIPFREKIPDLRDASRLKYALKQAVEDLVPPELLYAPKRGFGHGIQEKAIFLGPWRDIADRVFNNCLDAEGLFDTTAIKSLWREQKAGNEQVSWSLIAKLFSIQLWLQENHS